MGDARHTADVLFEFKREFPHLFAEPLSERMRSDLPIGWRSIAWSMAAEISAVQLPIGVAIKIAQIKEKFGTLRCYIHAHRDGKLVDDLPEFAEIESIVGKAVAASANTCLLCGKSPADLHRFGGWVATTCEEHGVAGTLIPDVTEDDDD